MLDTNVDAILALHYLCGIRLARAIDILNELPARQEEHQDHVPNNR